MPFIAALVNQFATFTSAESFGVVIVSSVSIICRLGLYIVSRFLVLPLSAHLLHRLPLAAGEYTRLRALDTRIVMRRWPDFHAVKFYQPFGQTIHLRLVFLKCFFNRNIAKTIEL